MENQEIYYIEESQSWTCPIAGRWKIIAVGGGASGGGGTTATSAGGTTSFGAIISAPGGLSTLDAVISASGGISGYGGYTGYTYGGAPGTVVSTVNITYGNGTVPPTLVSKGKPTAAIGWGAGGGACTTTSGGDAPAPTAGRAGEIRTTIVTLTAGDNIACTIGAGGTAPTTDKLSLASGADGVIVLQYLGE